MFFNKSSPRKPRYEVDEALHCRFWPRVEVGSDEECWRWGGWINAQGYGQIVVGGRKGLPVGAHRIAWELANNRRIPWRGVIRHSCDNPTCCNPKHLLLGTQADNMRDCAAKGRHPNGSKTHCSRGHPFNDANTLRYRGRRICLACREMRKNKLIG